MKISRLIPKTITVTVTFEISQQEYMEAYNSNTRSQKTFSEDQMQSIRNAVFVDGEKLPAIVNDYKIGIPSIKESYIGILDTITGKLEE